MRYQALTSQKKENVVIIWITGPVNDQVKTSQLSYELNKLCAEIAWDEQARVVIITGLDDKSFFMETSINETDSRVNEEEQIKFWSIAEPIAKLDRPVIAAISGNAVGQGLELVLACDIRIVSERSYFGLPHIKTGLIPWDGGTQRLSRLIGNGKALEMILTGELIDAKEAYRISLVNRVVPRDQVMALTMSMAQEMASKGPIALRYAKEAIHKGIDLTLEQGLRLEADLYLLIHTTKDRAEGIQAFRDKRIPKFEGR